MGEMIGKKSFTEENVISTVHLFPNKLYVLPLMEQPALTRKRILR